MFCEVTVKHRSAVTEAGLQELVCNGALGTSLTLGEAYSRSALYKDDPPHHSVGAFDTVHGCFVIVRKVNYLFSTYHVEGNSRAVSVQTLLLAVQDFSGLLLAVLAKADKPFRAVSLTVLLFEDNAARETGMEGKLTTLVSVLREQFAWASLRSSVIAFVTALMLIWLRLKQEPKRASIYSFVLVLVFSVLESAVSYILGRGKIKWKLRQT